MKAWSLLLITGIVLPVMVFSEPIHVDLDFVRVNYDYNDYSNAYDHRYHYGNELMFLKKETDAVFTVPQDIGSEPFFGILPLSGQNGNLAFGVAKGKDSECYEELFIDIDADGHIGDNERFYTKSIELKEIHVHAGPIFRPVLSVFTFKVPLDDKENRQRTNVYELVIETRKEPNEEKYEINELRIYLVNGGYHHGYFFLNGIKYEVALFDLVLNGNFDDRFNYYRRGNRHSADGFIVAPVGNLDLRELAAPEYLSKFKVINNTIYEVSVVPDGSGLTLTPSDIPKGCLQIKPAAEKIDLYNRLGVFRIRGEELFILPTGKYRIRSIRYSKEDTDVKWRLWTKQCDKLNSIEIKPDEKAAFPFGAPFTSTVSCMSNGGGSVYMDVLLTGKGGETYDWVSKKANVIWEKRVVVTIRKKPFLCFKGKVLAQVERIPERINQDVIIPALCSWYGPIPRNGAIASCDLKLPWKYFVAETAIMPQTFERKRPIRRGYQ